jgi:hypothetical protein
VCEGERDNLAQDVLADKSALAQLAETAPVSAQFYIHLEEEDELAGKLGLPDATTHPTLTRMFNTLYFLIRLEEDLDIPAIPRAQVRSSRLREPLIEMLGNGPLFVRGNESCGGSQAYRVEGEDDIQTLVKKAGRNKTITRYFASPFLDVEESWNAQYLLSEGRCELFGASRQELDGGYAHKGNIGGAKPPTKALETAEKIAQRLSEMGGRGMVGIDLLISGGTAYPAEINARENTSTPAIAVWRKTGAPHFRAMKAAVSRDFTFARFARMAGENNLFNPAQKRGAIPFHFRASHLTGMLDMALFAATGEELDTLAESIRHRLTA